MDEPTEGAPRRERVEYHVFTRTYRCGCGNTFTRLVKQEHGEPRQVESQCCPGRGALGVQEERLETPEWEIGGKVYGL